MGLRRYEGTTHDGHQYTRLWCVCDGAECWREGEPVVVPGNEPEAKAETQATLGAGFVQVGDHLLCERCHAVRAA
jgi:hypothetical protein